MSIFIKYLSIAGAILLPFSGGWILSKILPENKKNRFQWYDSLKKPPFNPPNYIFPIAWTFIFVAIGSASYLVYTELVAAGRGFDRIAQVALASYAIQLALNWAWSPIFFRFHSLKWSAIEGTALTISIIVNAYVFGQINKTSGLLFVPYITWSFFAKYLNFMLYKLNPDKRQ